MKSKLFMLLFTVIIVSCNNNEEVTKNDQDSLIVNDSIETMQTDEESEMSVDLTTHEFLINIIKADHNIKDSLEIYLSLISGDIKSQGQIEKAFFIRERILRGIESAAFHYLTGQQSDYDDNLEAALNKAGFQGIYSEGMFQGLDIAPVLEKEIEQYCSEEFKMKIKFQNAVASSYGSEYPFDSMNDEAEVVETGEEIMTRFPNSELSEEILEQYMRYVSYFSDFHAVTTQDPGYTPYIVGGLDIEMYPAGSDRSNFVNFVEKNPKSKFSPVIKNLLENPSTISPNKDEPVYLVVIFLLDTYEEANKTIFDFVNKGIDIPHHIIVHEKDKTKHAVVYRFFTDHQKAINALDYISSDHPYAEIIKVDRAGNTK